ncbi:MAG: LuxR family transcriptional regulator [Actinomycetia bacterium]|jgi:DNA-binding NarL/FixJ family response regulator|nr:LuxR family transcriptional regulator [Actinomycetes bacterium]
MTPLRVVVADDHPLVLEGLRSLIEDTPDTSFAGQAADGSAAVALVLEQLPDVVVMDLRMPGLDGVEATRQILRSAPGTAILILTMIDDDSSVFAAMRAGARGYVLKGAGPPEILRAIRVVASGEAIFGPAIADRMVHFFSASRTTPAFPELTSREQEILELMATGAANTAIAARLGLTEKTVRNNVSNIFAKLRVADRAAAVARARDAGLGDPHR